MLLWLGCFSLFAQTDKLEKLDSFLLLLEENDKAMGALVISDENGIDYQRGIGYANVEEQTPNTPETKFRIGSISKTFTALIIMQLVEEGKLSLSQPLSDFFPDLPQAGSISIKQLLAHRSGLYNFTNATAYLGYMESPKSREELLEIFRENGTVFKPGEKMEYANTNYVLLSFIAEDVEKQNFAEIFDKRIAQPLLLENTFIDHKDEKRQTAESYQWQGEWQTATHTDPSIPMGAGAVVSSPTELNRAFRAIFNHELCSKEKLEMMKEEKLGLFQFPFGDISAYGHNGGIDGFKSNAAYFPEKDVTITFLANGMNYTLNDVMLGVLSIYFDQPYQMPNFAPSLEVEESVLQKYSGQYRSDNFPMDISISVENGRLRGQATGQPAITLDAKSDSLFTFEQAGLELEFPEKDKMILRQNGQVFEFVRE